MIGNTKLLKTGETKKLFIAKQAKPYEMTLFEVLKISGHMLAALRELGYKAGDESYIPMFREYLEMVSRGDKITYVVATLANRYGVAERTIYNVVKRFSNHCNDVAESKPGK